jgi:surface antigen
MHIRTNQSAVGSRLVTKTKSKKSVRTLFRNYFLRSKKRLVRFSLVTANLALLMGVIVFISKAPALKQSLTSESLAGSNSNIAAGPLDQLSSADIAVNVARMVRLPESSSVTNLADSVSGQLLSSQSDEQITIKPLIASAPLPTKRDIRSYVTKTGDDLRDIAKDHSVSTDSIRWSNSLTGNSVPVGTTIYIPPSGVNGIVYVVKDGDTAASLADKFSADKRLVIAFNDAEIDGLVKGDRILIPGGEIEPPAQVYTNYFASAAFGPSAQLGYNGYDPGWCTWYAANRRSEIGRPVPGNLGHASWWFGNAIAQGIATGSEPRPGAVLVASTIGWGHVSVVEKVNPDGSFWVSEMNSGGQVSIENSTPTGGWNVRDYKMYQSAGGLKFIY